MRTSTFAILAALGSLAVAQDVLGSLPKCGQNCFGNNFAGCEQFNFACICGNKDLISTLSCCVATNCNEADQKSIIGLASGLCKANNVEVPTVASCAASASSTAASSTSSGSSGSAGSSSARGSSTTAAPTTTATASSSESQTAAAQSSAGSSTGSPGAAGPLATAHAGLGMAVGMAGLLAAAL